MLSHSPQNVLREASPASPGLGAQGSGVGILTPPPTDCSLVDWHLLIERQKLKLVSLSHCLSGIRYKTWHGRDIAVNPVCLDLKVFQVKQAMTDNQDLLECLAVKDQSNLYLRPTVNVSFIRCTHVVTQHWQQLYCTVLYCTGNAMFRLRFTGLILETAFLVLIPIKASSTTTTRGLTCHMSATSDESQASWS